MKVPIPIKGTAGFTMVETMITVSISAIVGGMIFLVLTSGMNLYAKNTAVNLAHQQARTGVDQLLQNIHGSVSVPQLVDANLVPTGGSGPAAGVSFQRFEAGPFPVVAFASAAATSIGNVLIVTVMTLAVVSAFVGLAVEYTNNVGRNVQRSISLRQATNIGDASTEISFSSWRSISRTMGSTVPTTSALISSRSRSLHAHELPSLSARRHVERANHEDCNASADRRPEWG